MINRGNWLHTKAYLDYRLKVDQIADGSFRLEKTYIRHLLEWAQETPFSKAPAIRPTLPEHLLSARLDGAQEQLSAVSIKKNLATARRFFLWLYENIPGHSLVKPAWSKTLKSKRLSQVDTQVDVISFDEIMAIANAPAVTVQDKRSRAAAVFWYLSGIRITAFVTLPIRAVDLKNGTVKQFPELGVRTKNKKRAETALLPIPELLEVVQSWDKEIRAVLPDTAYWFAHLLSTTGQINTAPSKAGKHRHNLARRNLKAWLAEVGLPYKNPHAFRHGHIHWGMSRAKDMVEFKAISENVMHSNVQITDKVYSNLKAKELKNRIQALGENQKEYNNDEVAELLELAAKQLKKRNA